MGRGKNHGVQKKIFRLMSNNEIWTNVQLYAECSKMKYGPDNWNSFYNMLGQLAKYTPRRLSETHEIVKIEEHRHFKQGVHRRSIEYMLQERSV